jgi:hypothetical protein
MTPLFLMPCTDKIQSNFGDKNRFGQSSQQVFEWLLVAYVSNYHKTGLGIEESSKKRLSIKALPNIRNIFRIMCWTNDNDGPCCIILQEWCQWFLVDNIQ